MICPRAGGESFVRDHPIPKYSIRKRLVTLDWHPHIEVCFDSVFCVYFFMTVVQAHQQAGEHRPPIKGPTPVAPPPPQVPLPFAVMNSDVKYSCR